MVAVGKRIKKAREKVEEGKTHSVEDALKLLKDTESPKFDETVELVMNLNVDSKKADQIIRGAVSLPKGLGKTKSVIVFAEGADADAAKEAGAAEVGSDELAKKIQDGWMDFDVCIATPAMMRVVGKLGKVLGPQGKMPSPKSGTVTKDVAGAVKEFAAGKLEFRADDGGNVHVPVGKKSFKLEDLQANIMFFIEHINNLRPATVKGIYVKKVVISATMSPGFLLDVN